MVGVLMCVIDREFPGAWLHDGSEYQGTYADSMSIEDLKNFHRKRLSIIANSGVDLIACETVPCLKGIVIIDFEIILQ